MNYQYVDQPGPFQALCDRLRQVPWLAFDTEFVSEHTYVPQLCLIQIATPQEIVVVDAYRLPDVRSFWQVLVDGSHVSIVHAGREELQFCYRATKAMPKHWFDVQLAAGFLQTDYPASYSRLVQRWLQREMSKGETRTDWRRRPLTDWQLEYAVGDVAHLADLRDALTRELDRRGRRSWLDQELSRQMQRSRPQPSEGWLKLQGVASLSDRARAIARAIWQWRNEQAEQRNCSPRRILRDDLIVEMARRGHTDPDRILAIRGVPRGMAAAAEEIGQHVEQALQQPFPAKGKAKEADSTPEVDLITQFLSVFLALRCRQESIATMLVGRAQEIRELVVNYRSGVGEPPELLQGWRADLVGKDLLRLLRGESTLRIASSAQGLPIVVDSVPGARDESHAS